MYQIWVTEGDSEPYIHATVKSEEEGLDILADLLWNIDLIVDIIEIGG